MIRSALTFHKKIHFNKSILTVVVLLSLLSYAGYIEAQDAPTLASATFFGGAGDQTAGSISVYGDKIFLTGNGTEMPDGITGDSIVLGYLDPPYLFSFMVPCHKWCKLLWYRCIRRWRVYRRQELYLYQGLCGRERIQGLPCKVRS